MKVTFAKGVFNILLYLLFSQNYLMAQQLKHVPGDLIVQLRPGYSPEDLNTASLRAIGNQRPSIQYQRQVVPGLPIHLFHFDQNRFHENDVLSQIRQHPAVQFAQFNHLVELRSVMPDDEYFTDQWQYINSNGIDLDADRAWEYTTGGITPLGDTIVVCVIDEGFDADHPDLAPNLWTNRHEIPNNDIDDDGNGYVDDYRGWNTYTSNDSINLFGVHGTSVAGIVGAKGNNGIGVTGVNWDVKLMLVVGGTGREDEALEAYGMALSHRKLYQETNGQLGAFVVATNTSWGVDFLFAEDAPIWCAFYDSLGQYGILNAAATTNRNINVDQQGDMPTTCPSDYLICVTNIDSTARKLTSAGYSNTSIDLGAFGHQVFTIYDQGDYRRFFGTSGASPHVAGAIALLYSADCEQLNLLARSNPAAAALLVKDQIMLGTLGSESLDTTTVSGGRLNLLTSMQLLLNQCNSCLSATDLEITDVRETEVTLSWTTFATTGSVDLFYRENGTDNYIAINNIQAPYPLTDLKDCSTYDYFLVANCETTSAISDTLSFLTACETSTGSQARENLITVFPNPFQEQLTIDAREKFDIRIFDTTGKWFFEQKNVIGTTVLNMGDLPPGVYFLEMIKDGERRVEKIVKN